MAVRFRPASRISFSARSRFAARSPRFDPRPRYAGDLRVSVPMLNILTRGIVHLSFVIAGGYPDSMSDIHWKISEAMTNDKCKMTNEQYSSLRGFAIY